MKESHEYYMNVAFEESFISVRNNLGGPFGAVVVMDGKIIGKGGNRVLEQNDPTAHAEIMAIREACKNINRIDLTGSVLYTTCEPCPMCFSAIYWANVQTVYFTMTRMDAGSMGFRDNHLYEELNVPVNERKVDFVQLNHHKASSLLKEWNAKPDKTSY
jgi:tRNA(Arg) A34 adenosine deaminase TadA